MNLQPSEIHIFTDGASLVHKGKMGGWSAVILYQHEIKEIFGAEPNTTNNRMELKAVIEGLKKIPKKNVKINVYSDSAYVVNGMNKWRFSWEDNNWKKQKQPIKNIDLWIELIEITKMLQNVFFHKIKGHAGIFYNERADELATNAIEEYKERKNTSNE